MSTDTELELEIEDGGVEPTDQQLYETDVLLELRRQIEELHTRLTEAERGKEQAEDNLQRFKERVVEVGERYATDHDMCSVYDHCMEEIGLPGRVRPWEFLIKVTYRQRVSVMGRTAARAKEDLQEAEEQRYWQPGLAMDVNGEAVGYAQHVEVEIVEDDVF